MVVAHVRVVCLRVIFVRVVCLCLLTSGLCPSCLLVFACELLVSKFSSCVLRLLLACLYSSGSLASWSSGGFFLALVLRLLIVLETPLVGLVVALERQRDGSGRRDEAVARSTGRGGALALKDTVLGGPEAGGVPVQEERSGGPRRVMVLHRHVILGGERRLFTTCGECKSGAG